MTKIGEQKIVYMSEKMKNGDDLSFLELFRELYISGLKFAADNPKFVRITELLLSSKGNIYDELMGDNIEIAYDFYRSYIRNDMEKGRIRKDIDVDGLCQIVIDMTTNVTTRQLRETGVLDEEVMLQKIDNLISIFKKGIAGE